MTEFIYKGNKIPVLSVKQPWAKLIIEGGKNIEKRKYKKISINPINC